MSFSGFEPTIKYDQKVFLDPSKNQKGDQLVACIKTLMGDDLHLCNMDFSNGRNAWNNGFLKDLKKHYRARLVQTDYRKDYVWHKLLPRFIIATGECVRTECCERLGHGTIRTQHSVLWDHMKNVCWHDPHPSRAGLVNIEMYAWLVKI